MQGVAILEEGPMTGAWSLMGILYPKEIDLQETEVGEPGWDY